MVTNEVVHVDRSHFLALAYQLDGLCIALRRSVGSGLKPGPGMLKALRTLRAKFASIHDGVSLEVLPSLDTIGDQSDVLTYAEILRSTVAMFLLPEEITDKHRALGFHSHEA
jgi:hypothetical protein